MSQFARDEKAELLERVLACARDRLGDERAGLVLPFVERYFRFVAPKDILNETADNLFGAVMGHWKLALRRRSGRAIVRVFNPDTEEHGWTSDRTVVEVVTDDMRFLVESLTAELNRQELTVHLVIHPVMNCRRDADGNWLGLADEGEGITPESFMHIRITPQSGSRLEEIKLAVEKVLADVRTAVDDWAIIREDLAGAIAGLDDLCHVDPEELRGARNFLQWVHEHNFTLLGLREYRFDRRGGRIKATASPGSGLGLLRDQERILFDDPCKLAERPEILLITKADVVSTVRRAVFMDVIGVRVRDAKGKIKGVRLYAGLFTATAYNQSVMNIPMLRDRCRLTVERAGFRPGGHDGKALLNILENFPRDELFQSSDDHLLETALGILHLQERQRVALFVRRDDFGRFVSCLVYIPRDHFTTELRRRMQGILEAAYKGSSLAYYTQLGDGPLARLHVLIRIKPDLENPPEIEEVEAALAEATRSWTDLLAHALTVARGEEKGMALARRYRHAFGSAYRERFATENAVHDIEHVEEVLASGRLGMNLYRPLEAAEKQVRFKVFRADAPIPLSDVLPMLEHMGLRVIDEIPYRVRPEANGGRLVMIHDFGLESRDGSAIDLGVVRDAFQEAFLKIWCGEVESDGLNALVLRCGLSWRQVVALRAMARFLRQAGIPFSQSYMEETIVANSGLARDLVELFQARFDPEGGPDANRRQVILLQRIQDGLEKVAGADEDRILRRFLNLLQSSLRTNYFQTMPDGGPKPWLSLKLDSRALDDLPPPRPLVEIFVYSPRVEGVHLRFGKVARGGLRWSDRREDFRTEILGLVKAQVVKNAVIVPVGSKGGFVVKRLPQDNDRDAVQKEGITCYGTFIRGLLDLTDNLRGDGLSPPPDTLRHDGDDPYLVVAADKGTASFSDTANAIAGEYGFWLGDAFASGGSQGYDHKKMGITARGAWECVKRHFREMGRDIQTRDFTVIGIGDMGGDVFGNGMLMSPHIRLVAAFNHQHIFIDPEPDAAAGFRERERLFRLPRSTWKDYDATLISKGGGVFERKAKWIAMTPEIRAVFGIKADRLTPSELIKVLLQAEVDLLWLGGIGTYVKETGETNGDVGDRANDSLRIDASRLRCRVVGEGANLGLTQRARIEFALKGGRINADFIDNAGGVNCSDHEVNIKILLDAVVAAGDMTGKQRNALLVRMTDEVAELVLRDNYLQSQAIGVVAALGPSSLDDQARLMRMLEKAGRLDRGVEFLPDDETLAERQAAGQGLTRPEIAVLMSYAKIWLYDELLHSPLPDDGELGEDLVGYFPSPLRHRFKRAIRHHRLKREIVATRVTNSLVNRVGGTFVSRLAERTGMTPGDIARAYTIARQVFGLRELWAAVEELDNRAPAEIQTNMLLEINALIERATLWFLRHGSRPLDIGRHIAAYRGGVDELVAGLDRALPSSYLEDVHTRAGVLAEKGVPEELAHRIASLVNLAAACDVVDLADAREREVTDAARIYFAVGTRFRLGHLRAAAERLPASSHWQRLAAAGLIEELHGHQRELTAQVLDAAPGEVDPARALDAWAAVNRAALDRTEQFLGELWSCSLDDFAQVTVASRQLRALAEAPPSAP